MNNSIKIIIPGKPIPWKRARTSNGRYYNSQEGERHIFQLQLKNQLPENWEIISGPVELLLNFYFQGLNEYHVKKPDLDNCIKFVLDAGNKLIYKDDNQVYLIQSGKHYSTEPRTEIEAIY